MDCNQIKWVCPCGAYYQIKKSEDGKHLYCINCGTIIKNIVSKEEADKYFSK